MPDDFETYQRARMSDALYFARRGYNAGAGWGEIPALRPLTEGEARGHVGEGLAPREIPPAAPPVNVAPTSATPNATPTTTRPAATGGQNFWIAAAVVGLLLMRRK